MAVEEGLGVEVGAADDEADLLAVARGMESQKVVIAVKKLTYDRNAVLLDGEGVDGLEVDADVAYKEENETFINIKAANKLKETKIS